MATSVLAELFGQYRSRILELLFLNPGESFHLRGIAARTGVPPSSLHSMLPNLLRLGLLRTAGGSGGKRYQANLELPGAVELGRLIAQYSLPTDRLRQVANSLPSVVAAAVFGSYAFGSAQSESDIDVLIVGEISRIEAQASFNKIAREFSKKINVTVLTREEFKSQAPLESSFVAEVLSNPLIPLKGDLHALAAS